MNAIQAIKLAARQYGIRDWKALAAVANAESGLNPGSIGDGGSSFGLFQLHQGGALGSMGTSQARQYLDAYRNASFAARQIKQMGIGHLAGRDAIAAFVSRFERPANPSGEIERAYQWYTGNGGSSGSAPAAPQSMGMDAAASSPSPSPVSEVLAQSIIDSNARQFHLPRLTLPIAPVAAATSQDASSSAPAAPQFSASAGGGYPAARKGKLIGSPHSGTHTLGNWQSDNAVDIALPVGTPILAAQDGVISPRFGSLGRGGRFAGLRINVVGGNQSTYYAHLSRVAPGIKPGVRVKAGQVIGFSGSANGVAHLHFGVMNGTPYQYVGR